MENLWGSLNGLEIVFVLCAAVGGVFLVLRLILQFFGADADVDADAHTIDTHHMDADVSFKLISVHGLTSFLLMFGLVGVALYRQSGSGAAIALFGGMVAGLIAVWVIGKLFRTIGKFQSSGTMDMTSAVGSKGTVYLTIPRNGTGRVTMNFKNRLREFDAVSHSKDRIDTGTPVKVIWVDGTTLVVDKVK